MDSKDVSKTVNALEDTIKGLDEVLKPLMNFTNLGKLTDDLKKTLDADDIITPSTEGEGETCMHGNAWNSECADCQEIGLIDSVFDLVKAYPNDQELGQKVRELYNTFNTDSDNTEE